MRQSVDGFAEKDKGAREKNKKMRNEMTHTRAFLSRSEIRSVFLARDLSRGIFEAMAAAVAAACAERRV